MLEKIKFLGNIGAFESVGDGATLSLGPLTLIYAENGRGKTTLAAVLRSLATGDDTPISERHRLGAGEPPKAVVGIPGGADAVFDGDGWNVDPLGTLKIFDDQFVATNVCSGLEVYNTHREKLHELILGERGFALSRAIQHAYDRIEGHNTELQRLAVEIRSAVPREIAASLRSKTEIEQFCRLPEQENIAEDLNTQQQQLTAAENHEEIQRRPLINELSLPAFDPDAINHLLQRSLDDLEANAAQRTKDHVNDLGPGAEQWLSQGVTYASSQAAQNKCPFCAQDLSGSSVIAHYRHYFGDEYRGLKGAISQYLRDVRTTHSDTVRTDFERAVGRMDTDVRFWSNFRNFGTPQIDAPLISDAWMAARDQVVAHLETKLNAPLDALMLDQQARDAIARYTDLGRACSAANANIKQANQAIMQVKETANEANREAIQARIDKLVLVEVRHSATVAPGCDAYIAETDAAERAKAELQVAKDQLEAYRNSAFPAAEAGVNQHLDHFTADFGIEGFRPQDRRSGPTSGYALKVVGRPVGVRSERSSDREHSFGNTLSAGDRNSLALAFFLDSVERHEDLSGLIVVFDDPVSSLDDHRLTRTVETICGLLDKVKQVVVLSHSTRFLGAIWHGVKTTHRKSASTIQIVRHGNGSSLRNWHIEDSLREEHDRRHQQFVKFCDSGEGDALKIARDLRDHIERFLRVAFPGEFPPEKELKHFMVRCTEALTTDSPILLQNRLVELQQIVRYANKFHHDAKGQPRSPDINLTELHGYTKRVLAFARAP